MELANGLFAAALWVATHLWDLLTSASTYQFLLGAWVLGQFFTMRDRLRLLESWRVVHTNELNELRASLSAARELLARHNNSR